MSSSALVLPGAAGAGIGLADGLAADAGISIAEVRTHGDTICAALAGAGGAPIARVTIARRTLPEGQGLDQPDRQLLDRLFGLLDADGDRSLTGDEWPGQIERDLASADADGDGAITLEELTGARETLGLGEALDLIF